MADALVGSALLVAYEWAVVGWRARGEFAGPWEIREGLLALVPLTWLVVAPVAVLFSALLVLARMNARAARFAVAFAAGAFSALLGYGTSHGRHFAAVPSRVLFVGALAGVGFALAYALGPRLGRLVERAPRVSALAAVLIAMGLEWANGRVLPRLYPAFHLGLAAMTAMTAGVAAAGLGLWSALPATLARRGERDDARQRRWVSAAVVLLGLAFGALAASAPVIARRPTLSDNVRLIFLDRAPLLGHGVTLAAKLGARNAPKPSDEVDAASGPRLSVDWRGRDVLLISVDALRADHVGAYGYGRPTTPHLDALAREGALFAWAYCPTPHTSYSIASMMTGKALKPLLAQGLGADSDTLAGILRSYGYRTAAFYPPAVFFVDAELFLPWQARQLDFEFARVEFAEAPARARALGDYLASEPESQRLLLWVHLFEPHEPYVAHEAHPFGSRDIDRYDSEIAFADAGIGEIVGAVRSRRPGTVIVITADHGEEFGEHNGRYHGTTVYEEQVRVPLIVVTPGLAGGRRIAAPVQTIDILPTLLSALDIPRPPRIRGNDLGPWLGNRAPAREARSAPPAFAETDEDMLLAQNEWRLICSRRASACALYNLDLDPGEAHDVSREHTERFATMKAMLHGTQSAHGRYESAAGLREDRPWPEPIRRGMAKESDAAAEIALLLDDSDVVFRRKAAELLFELRSGAVVPELHLCLSRADDAVVHAYCALALSRLGQPVPQALEMLKGADESWRRLAALALAESGDRRGAGVLASWWQAEVPPFERAREVLAAMARIKDKEAVPVLVRSLDDVRLRPYVANTLAAIGEASARAPLAAHFAVERYQDARAALGDALVRLGAKGELVEPLVHFLGTPDPLSNGLDLALRAGILPRIGGPTREQLIRLGAPAHGPVALDLTVPPGSNGSLRRFVLLAHLREGHEGHVAVEWARGQALVPLTTVQLADTAPTEHAAVFPTDGNDVVHLVVTSSSAVAIDALAVVPLTDELPPPPPEPWRAAATGGAPAASSQNLSLHAPAARIPRAD